MCVRVVCVLVVSMFLLSALSLSSGPVVPHFDVAGRSAASVHAGHSEDHYDNDEPPHHQTGRAAAIVAP